MAVESILTEPGFEVQPGEFTYYLSQNEVVEATKLAKHGEQRLRPVSETRNTFFFFLVSVSYYKEYFAPTIVKISPVTHPEFSSPTYEIIALYEPCCNANANANAEAQVDGQIKSCIQLVYDTYIRPVQRTLDDSCYRKRAPDLVPCQEKKEAFLEWLSLNQNVLKRKFRGETEISDDERLDESSRDDSEEECAFSTVPPPKRLHNGDTGTETLQVDETISQKKKKEKEAADNLKIAENLIKKIKSTIEKMKERKIKHPSNPLLVQNLMLMCYRYRLSDTEIDETLEKLYNALIARGKAFKLEKDTQIWWNWYTVSCYYLSISHRDNGKRRRTKRLRSALGANPINMILNHLVRTEGIKAVTFLDALAEINHHLTEAAYRSEPNQKAISRMVADGLRGELLPPPEHDSLITFPAVWIGIVTQKSYEETCKSLGCPNFAVLKMEPRWIISPEGGYQLAERFTYSVLAKRWALFQSFLHRRLRGPVDANQSVDEEELDEEEPSEEEPSEEEPSEEEFEMVANKWLQPKLPSTVSAPRQDNGQSTAQDNSILLDPGTPLHPCQMVDTPTVPTDINVNYQIWPSDDDMHLIQPLLSAQLKDLNLEADFTRFFDLSSFSSPPISTY